jgi:hypothetical protein
MSLRHSDVSKEHGSFIFREPKVRSPNIKALRSFETSGTDYPVTLRNISDGRGAQPHRHRHKTRKLTVAQKVETFPSLCWTSMDNNVLRYPTNQGVPRNISWYASLASPHIPHSEGTSLVGCPRLLVSIFMVTFHTWRLSPSYPTCVKRNPLCIFSKYRADTSSGIPSTGSRTVSPALRFSFSRDTR